MANGSGGQNFYGNDPSLGAILPDDQKYSVLSGQKGDVASSANTFKVGTGPNPNLSAGIFTPEQVAAQQTSTQTQPTFTSSIQQPIDTRYQSLLGQAGQQAVSPTLPAGGVQKPIQIEQITPGELQTAPLITAPQPVTTTPIQTAPLAAPLPTVADPAQIAAATSREVAPTAPVAAAVLGQINAEDLIDDVQGPLSSGALAQAQTEALDEKATVQFQLGELYKSLDDGTQLPAWAAPVARNVDNLMLQRGLGASSMAAAARTQALFESALPIAAADADKYASIQLQNLNNKQATALQNAAETATMDRANLDVRMRSAQQNATSFLQMNMANVSNDQATNNLNHQSRMQELFNDQAVINSARNFNATSQNQVDQFYSTLGNQVEQANRARDVATQQFNVGTENAVQQFNETIQQERGKFNATMQHAIDQSNVNWRRQITTLNNQIANRAEQANAQNLLGISEARQNQLWQAYRDEALWANQSHENEESRAQALALSALSFNQSLQLSDIEQDSKLTGLLGGFGLNFLNDQVNSKDSFLSNLFGGGGGGSDIFTNLDAFDMGGDQDWLVE